MKPESYPNVSRPDSTSALREPRLADYVRLFSAAAIWGATFLCNEVALADFSPVAITAYRILLAALLLLIICYWRGQRFAFERRTIGFFALIGTLNSVVPFILIGWGQLSIDSSTTAILLASSPFAALLLSHFMTQDDRFAWNKLFGLVLGFIGVCVLLGKGLQQGSGTFTGMLAVVLAGCCYALSSILIRRLGSVPSLVLAAGTLVCAGLVMVPVLLIRDAPWEQAYRPATLGALAFLAIGPTAIGYVLRAQIVKLNGAVFMSNVGYLIPMFAVLWAWLFLGNRPSSTMLVALCLILFGIALGQNRVKKKFWSKRSDS
ncbi:MAG: DMT family transporter [Granulosicoccus sp.]